MGFFLGGGILEKLREYGREGGGILEKLREYGRELDDAELVAVDDASRRHVRMVWVTGVNHLHGYLVQPTGLNGVPWYSQQASTGYPGTPTGQGNTKINNTPGSEAQEVVWEGQVG